MGVGGQEMFSSLHMVHCDKGWLIQFNHVRPQSCGQIVHGWYWIKVELVRMGFTQRTCLALVVLDMMTRGMQPQV